MAVTRKTAETAAKFGNRLFRKVAQRNVAKIVADLEDDEEVLFVEATSSVNFRRCYIF